MQLPSDSKYILSFKKAYDSHFADFKEKLMIEYEQMRGEYTLEISNSLQKNEDGTENNIRNGEAQIHLKQIETEALAEAKRFTRNTMGKLFKHKQNIYVQRIALKAWVQFKI